MSPVITILALKPSLVRNIFICSEVRVLRLIEDDEGIVQRAAAHVGERSDLDGAFLGQRRDLLRLQHVVEGIVQRPQIGMHLLDEIAREEAETLTRLDGRTRQDDARNLALDEGRHGHRHGEIGLARPRGADGDHQIVAADGVEIPLLVHGLRCDLLAPRGHARWPRREVLSRRPSAPCAVSLSADRISEAPSDGPLPQHLDEIAQHALRLAHLALLAPKGHVVSARGDAHVVSGFEGSQVLVVPAEQSEMIEIGGRTIRRVAWVASVNEGSYLPWKRGSSGPHTSAVTGRQGRPPPAADRA